MAITLDGTTGITTPGLTNTGTETIVNLTTTGNTTLGDATADTLNVGAGGIVKDASGNVTMAGTLTTLARGIAKASMPAGSVLQVVQSVYSTAFSTTSTSYVSTGATASITPTSATSKILAQVSVDAGNGSNQWHYFTLYRGATNISGGSGNAGGYLTQNSIDYLTTINFQILDSPVTTSSTTYTLYTKSSGGNSVRAQVDGMPTYITLMEIAV